MEKILRFNIRILIVYFFLILAYGALGQKKEGPVATSDSIEQPRSQQISIKPIEEKKTAQVADKVIQNSPTQTEVANNGAEEAQADQTGGSAIDDLPRHNNPSDCWIYIEGHIYDITSYFGNHPGGDAIMVKYCGSDATGAFNTKEKGVPHSGNAHAILANFLVE